MRAGFLLTTLLDFIPFETACFSEELIHVSEGQDIKIFLELNPVAQCSSAICVEFLWKFS